VTDALRDADGVAVCDVEAEILDDGVTNCETDPDCDGDNETVIDWDEDSELLGDTEGERELSCVLVIVPDCDAVPEAAGVCDCVCVQA
jgi:hypothetical protein